MPFQPAQQTVQYIATTVMNTGGVLQSDRILKICIPWFKKMDLFSYRTSFQGEEVKDYLLLSLERYATPKSSLAALFCSLSEKQLPFGQGRSVGEYLFFCVSVFRCKWI